MQRRKQAANRSDVARLAKVAPSTVSLVLNATPGPRIPDETRQRVMDAARQLGYSSSTIARALVTGRTMTVGVVVHFVERPFHQYAAGILDGFWMAMRPQGYRMLLVPGGTEACVAGLYRERSVDGLIVLAAHADAADPELKSLAEAGFPAVFIGTRPTAVRTDYVDIDNVATARQATEELIRAGHRDILHLAGPLDVNSAARDRRDGYVAALRAAGLPVRENLIIDCSFNGDFVDPRLSAAMDAGLRFSAIFAANYSMARAASAVLAKRGLRIPADVSLITIDADDTLRNEIRTVAQPLEGIGSEAGRLLLERMTGTGGPPRSVFMPCQLSGAATVAPPR